MGANYWPPGLIQSRAVVFCMYVSRAKFLIISNFYVPVLYYQIADDNDNGDNDNSDDVAGSGIKIIF